MSELHLICDEAGVSSGDPFGDCTAPVWAEIPSAIPDLSSEDALAVAASALVLWALAYGIREIVRFIR